MDFRQIKYSYILFLTMLISLTSFGQKTVKKTTFLDRVFEGEDVRLELKSQNNTAIKTVARVGISSQFIVKLFNPKGGFATTDKIDQTPLERKERSSIKAFYATLAKDNIENYKYDFSETFIDILFFDDIDLARKRTI